jgi:hypothetical protein
MTHPDLEQIKGMLLRTAQKALASMGSYYPFGITISTDGKFASEQGPEGKEKMGSLELNNYIIERFHQQAASGQLRAAGVCAIATMNANPPHQPEKTQAIYLELEHLSGQSEFLFVPFKKGLFGKVKYGEPYYFEGIPKFFRTN